MARVVIVCGYDRFTDIDRYSEKVAGVLAGERFDAVIVSGGVTNTRSDRSEAEMMARVLSRSLPSAVIVLEEFAMTTLDNLVFSRECALERFALVDRFLVVCDLAHRLKVTVLARIVLGRVVEVRSVPRRVPWRILAFEPFSILFESLAAFVPPLGRLMSLGAARWKGVTPKVPRSAQREVA